MYVQDHFSAESNSAIMLGREMENPRKARMEKMKALAADAEKQSSILATQVVEAKHAINAAQSHAARGRSPNPTPVVSNREFGRVLVSDHTTISSDLTQEIQTHAVHKVAGDKSVTQRSNFYTVDQSSMERVGSPRSTRANAGNQIDDLLGELARG